MAKEKTKDTAPAVSFSSSKPKTDPKTVTIYMFKYKDANGLEILAYRYNQMLDYKTKEVETKNEATGEIYMRKVVDDPVVHTLNQLREEMFPADPAKVLKPIVKAYGSSQYPAGVDVYEIHVDRETGKVLGNITTSKKGDNQAAMRDSQEGHHLRHQAECSDPGRQARRLRRLGFNKTPSILGQPFL